MEEVVVRMIQSPELKMINPGRFYSSEPNVLVKAEEGEYSDERRITFNVVDVDGNLLLKIVKGYDFLVNLSSTFIIDPADIPFALLSPKTCRGSRYRSYRSGKRGTKKVPVFKVSRSQAGFELLGRCGLINISFSLGPPPRPTVGLRRLKPSLPTEALAAAVKEVDG